MTSNKTNNHYPLSSPQIDIWFDQILHPDVPLYNIGGYVRIEGTIDPAIFEKALNQVITENDALRIIIHAFLLAKSIGKLNAIKLRFFCRVGRAIAKPTIVINFNELVGAAKLYPPYKKNAFMLNLMALSQTCGCIVGKKKNIIFSTSE